MAKTRDILDDHRKSKLPDNIDNLREVVISGECDQVGLVTAGVDHELNHSLARQYVNIWLMVAYPDTLKHSC